MHVNCAYLPHFIQIKQSRRSYDVISISQDGGYGVTDLAVACLVTGDGTRLSYYHFRFPKTNGRHIGIFLPVCNLTTYIAALFNTTKFRQRTTIQTKVISIY